ncbi:MAG: CfrBI family restriction endonuclease, partial [Candidatus Poribacteria bacterium]|nr:CfrBI family restriction endonuclease [Candidatus Poribacteria bacterium]
MTTQIIKNIIHKLIAGQDHYSEIMDMIDAEFLQYTVDFLKRIVKAKLHKEPVTADWYKEEFLQENSLSKMEEALHPAVDTANFSNSQQMELDATLKHHYVLYDAFNSLGLKNNLGMTFTIKVRQVSFDLNLNESLILFNTFAVKGSTLQKNSWNAIKKQVEKPLMIALCALFQVPQKYFDQRNLPESEREADFYLFDDTGKDYPCEVKLMGRGNPESADAVFARSGRVLVANKLSDTNKQQMDSENILWVELQTENGYRRFEEVLKTLS